MRKSLIDLLKQHKWFLIPFLFFIGICFYLEVIIPKADLFLIINGFYSNNLDIFFRGTTYIGDGITMIVFGLILCAFSFRYGLLTLIAYAYTSLIAQIIKYSFHSPRPTKFFSDLHQPIRTIEGYPIYEWNSFPSGHSVSAFSLAVVIAWLLPEKHKRLAWLILPIAILTAFSRVYLAQHFF
ncbi:MAG: phosphatase family protein, partial [Daejeonella sp.]|nr:phosphatase family protein [Daejeonella sp.]